MTHSETELIYRHSEGRQLRATFCQPHDVKLASSPNQNAEPFFIDVHGGAWNSGHRKTVDIIAAQWLTKGSQFSPLIYQMVESQNTPRRIS